MSQKPESEFHDIADDPRACYSHHPVEDLEPDLAASAFATLGDALAQVLVWLSAGYPANADGERVRLSVSIRLAALLFCVRPDLVGNSLREVSKRIGVPQETVRRHVDDFRRRFGPKPCTQAGVIHPYGVIHLS